MKNRHGQRGEISLLLIPLTSVVFCYYLFAIFTFVDTTKSIVSLQDHYLCFAQIKQNSENLLNNLSVANKTHLALIPLTFVPKSAIIAKQAINTLKISEELMLKNYQRKILSNKRCTKKIQMQVLAQFPLGRLCLHRTKNGLINFPQGRVNTNLVSPIVGIKFKYMANFALSYECNRTLVTWFQQRRDQWKLTY